jgi:hypothetical protein
LVIGHIALMT